MDASTVRYLAQEVDAVAAAAQTINIQCSRCGAVGEYAPSGLRVTLLRDVECYYEVFCYAPACRAYAKVTIDADMAASLYDAGVTVRVLDVPAEVRSRRPDAPSITDEDMAQFVRHLEEL